MKSIVCWDFRLKPTSLFGYQLIYVYPWNSMITALLARVKRHTNRVKRHHAETRIEANHLIVGSISYLSLGIETCKYTERTRTSTSVTRLESRTGNSSAYFSTADYLIIFSSSIQNSIAFCQTLFGQQIIMKLSLPPLTHLFYCIALFNWNFMYRALTEKFNSLMLLTPTPFAQLKDAFQYGWVL